MKSFFKCFNKLISLIATLGIPSLSIAYFIFLIATFLLVFLSNALYTTPYAPFPISFNF